MDLPTGADGGGGDFWLHILNPACPDLKVSCHANSLFLFLQSEPKPGDLIEIFRPMYRHWAIYVGDGYVIHLAPPSKNTRVFTVLGLGTGKGCGELWATGCLCVLHAS